MAINPASLPIQLLPGQAQLAGLTQNLESGDLLRGRVVELLAGQKAVISLNGTNLLAELPAGNAIQRGDILTLQVLSSDAKQVGQAPAISLKLLSNLPKELSLPTNSATPPIPPHQVLEASLLSARLPISNTNLELVASLARVGLPLDPATLHSVIQITDALVEVQNPGSAPVAIPSENIQLANALKDLRAALTMRLGESSPQALVARVVIPNLEAASQTLVQRPLAPAQLQILVPQTQAILERVLSTGPMPTLEIDSLVQEIKLAIQTSAPNATLPTIPVPQQNSVPIDTSLLGAATRELAAVLLAGPIDITPQNFVSSLNAAIPDSNVTVPSSALRSLQAQFPTADLQTLNAALVQAKQSIIQAFVASPPSYDLKNSADLTLALRQVGLNPPSQDLAALPRVTVQEAVIFLKARNIDVTRAAVEAVATYLSSDGDLSAPLSRIAETQTQMPKEALVQHPALNQALTRLSDTLRALALDGSVEHNAFNQQIKAVADKLGMNLEHDLALANVLKDPKSATTTVPLEQTLKAVLETVHAEASKALASSSMRSQPDVSLSLQATLKDVSSALASLTTSQLAARPTPAYEVLNIQLPVWAGGQMQRGDLSVYWRRGAAKDLNERDPVNVLINLDTRGLGPVRVLMQAFKSECRCQVLVQDKTTLNFVRGEGSDLRHGFDERTPFNLSRLDFGLLAETAGLALDNALSLLPGASGPRQGGSSLDLKV